MRRLADCFKDGPRLPLMTQRRHLHPTSQAYLSASLTLTITPRIMDKCATIEFFCCRLVYPGKNTQVSVCRAILVRPHLCLRQGPVIRVPDEELAFMLKKHIKLILVWLRNLARFRRNAKASALIEYALLIGLVSGAVIVLILAVGGWTLLSWTYLVDALSEGCKLPAAAHFFD